MSKSVREGPSDIYRSFQRVLVAQNRTNAALEVAEQGRAHTFAELLSTRLAIDIPNQPTSAPPGIDRIAKIARSLPATLVSYSLLYDDDRSHWLGRLSFGREQPYIHASILYIWAIQPTGEIGFRSVDLRQLWQTQRLSLAGLVRGTRDCLNSSKNCASGSPEAYLEQLYGFLIEPIADLLPDNPQDKLIVIPQDFLFLVPFAALKQPSGEFVLDRHTLAIAPSIQALELFADREACPVGTYREVADTRTDRMLAVGNPTMVKIRPNFGEPPQPLPDLPQSQQEAEAIAKLFATQAMTGDRATKAEILAKMPEARWIHLATHGFLSDVEGIPCAIALAPAGSQESGLLTARELFGLRLNAELAVLSGCDTGKGDLWGDGVVGLIRGFMAAGVPNVMLSLWSIQSEAKTGLMLEFYRQLRQHGDMARALRGAMLAMREQFPHPRDWAAFALSEAKQ